MLTHQSGKHNIRNSWNAQLPPEINCFKVTWMQVLSTDLSVSMGEIHPMAECSIEFSATYTFGCLHEQILSIHFQSRKHPFGFHLSNKDA